MNDKQRRERYVRIRDQIADGFVAHLLAKLMFQFPPPPVVDFFELFFLVVKLRVGSCGGGQMLCKPLADACFDFFGVVIQVSVVQLSQTIRGSLQSNCRETCQHSIVRL